MPRLSDLSRRARKSREQLAKLQNRAGERAVPPFHNWLPLASPTFTWNWPHLVLIQRYLEKITTGEIDRLAIFCPPRHGKSEMSSVRYPVWRIERDPTIRVVLGAYNQGHAQKLSRKARKVARERFRISRDRNTAIQWETDAGGGFRACGVGSPPMGEGANLLIIDDPIKSRKEADSPAYRENVWDWYSEDLLSRLEPKASVILIQTRWHPDDLAGRILGSEDAARWSVVNLPALAEENDPLGRAIDEALCPERFSQEDLFRKRKSNAFSFAALYQQRPTPREGNMFKRAWFEHFEDKVPLGCVFVRYWDKAGTKGGGCYTAGVLMARDRVGKFYVVDVRRKQLDSGEREAWIKQTAEEDKAKYGHVTIGVEQEPGSSGKESANATIRNLVGFSVYADPPCGSKVIRADSFATQCGAGNVTLIRGAWIGTYLDELCSFPSGTYLDQVDASSGAFARLAPQPAKGSWGMERH